MFDDPSLCQRCGGPGQVYMGGGEWDVCPCNWDIWGEDEEDELGERAGALENRPNIFL